jgi:hypothetical protein
MWPSIVAGLKDLVWTLGVPGAIILSAIVVGAALILGYMLLVFGDEGLRMLLPFMRDGLSTLRGEFSKAHPAIRLELRLHYFFGAVLLFCLGASVLHALIPWVREGTEKLLVGGFVTSFVVCIGLAVVSLTLSVRLK